MRKSFIFYCSLLIVSCVPTPNSPSTALITPFASFLDIPGITAEEIAAVEVLQQAAQWQQNYAFIYGTTPNSESFIGDDGELHGFTALFCEWMTDLFGIRFRPKIYSWGDLISGLERDEIDFTGELTPTEERREIYFMTSAIAERTVKYFRIQDSPSFEEIARLHPLRYAFLTGTTTWQAVTASFLDFDYETVFLDDSSLVYDLLKSGHIDAFFNEGPGEYIFDVYGDVISYSFVPLIFESVSLATHNVALVPIISLLQKAILSGGRAYISQLYNQGHLDYLRYKLNMRLSAEELAYLENNSVIRLAAEYDGYPVSFYNSYEKEWQGIAFDILYEVGQLTGLKVEVANRLDTEWPQLLEMLRNGEAAMVTELLHTDDREGLYIWTKNNILSDNFALISKSEYPNLGLNDIMNARVALRKDTAYAELFHKWFSGHAHTFEYSSHAYAFEALMKGEVDVVMSDRKELLYFSNYHELPGYKVNLAFNRLAESTFGFNLDEGILAGIIDKTLLLIEVDAISSNWIYKTYNYRSKVLEAQRPWLFGAIGLSLAVLVLILILFYRKRSEGKLLEKVVKEKTSFITTILDTTPDLIFRVDINSRFTEFNSSMEKHFNIRKQDILGKDTNSLGVRSDLAAQYMVMDRKVFNENQTIAYEEIIPSHDGKQLLFETIKTPVIQDGKLTGLVGMARDITRRKSAEEEALNASRAKSRFIANMSHEMRTPMNVIVGLTDLLLEEGSANIKETLEKINTAGTALMGLINNVLDISKIEAGKQDLNPVQYDVPSLLNDIITLNIIRIADKPITFKLEIEDKFPCTLFGDDLHIKQILNNLLSNAFKYTEKGTVTLRAGCQWDGTALAAPNDLWVSFSVSDTGIGIRKEDMAKLFTEYNQADTSANRKIEGTGLGLSITKKIVELMGGEISVGSEYGKGTTFHVRIRQGFITDMPIAKETVESLNNFHYLDEKKQARVKLIRPDLGYARVLVVDDFPTNLDVAVGMLRKYKMQVDCLDNGQDAVSRIAAGEPAYNAVFMDHMMPGMDGIEATKMIRALGTKYAKEIPIIALTANAVAGNEQMFLDNGFNAFLPKPFNAMTLDSIVQRCVRDESKEK
ncbi:MAG: transporter substrate-binding domain-containing protein [Treponema sp.]|jgi:PAS domain S-box-containing protein|nr:transporter substrate-binding domain-containing protein [Treponema sp.]